MRRNGEIFLDAHVDAFFEPVTYVPPPPLSHIGLEGIFALKA